ncbi:aspartyl protease family protein [Sphingomonas immobilis]|uniref:Aspartyl protease family protein n=1 Tax=Sphingomonas immobilis TaxID=3063997 RepID=A0ABT9A4N4_9SPHN|nr:aspartyl protease family protein [Sphingomonas sp. CA1-15]MDO7843682.1 aspartyl protease family protein [Sphingomonas sp. CA1-15]
MLRVASLILCGTLFLPAAAHAECTVEKFLEIPVAISQQRAVVTARFDGKEARFILDSGAFYSTIARANALEYGLKPESLGNARIRGIGGTASLGVATATNFEIAGQTVPRIEFGVGGSDTGFAGLLGQNILGIADVEYDFLHGAVRLMRGKGCKDRGLAYWAGDRATAVVPLEPMSPAQRHTIGTVTVNGVKVKAMFDTGAPRSSLTLKAAKRIGVTPDSPGVTRDGFARGLGTGQARTWRARFDTIDIGGETIKRPWINITERDAIDVDMIIGFDFFLSHRLYVDNANHRMFVSYAGGPMFGLDPKGAVDDKGTALDLTDTAGEPKDAAGYARRAGVASAGRKYDAAIADLDKALALAPDDAHYLFQRAVAYLSNRQPLLGAADLDKAIALAPNDAEPRLARAGLRLGARDPDGALTDLKAADQALAPSSDMRLRLGGMAGAANDHDLAIANFSAWLTSHTEDHDRAVALNGRCFSRAMLGKDVDKALDDCNAALRLRPGVSGYLDSRALVWFRRGALDKALADYDAAIVAQPRNGWSLYMRGTLKRRLGKTAEGDADRTAALAINPRFAERAKRYHLDE